MSRIKLLSYSFILVILAGLFFVAGCQQEVRDPIGGEMDEHGCLGPAGYSWSEEIGACIRVWEINGSKVQAAKMAVAPLSYTVTVVGVDIARCPGCFVVHLQRNDNQSLIDINIVDWKIVQGDANADGISPSECENYDGRIVNTVGGDDCIDGEENTGDVIGFISPNICCVPVVDTTTDRSKAVSIAKNSVCANQGTVGENAYYNMNSDTWWVDFTPSVARNGCNPACVVSLSDYSAEINWMCTGLVG